LFGVRAVEELDERKASRPAGFPIDGQHDLRGRRYRAEVRPKVGFGSAVRKITNEQSDGQSTHSSNVMKKSGRDARGGTHTLAAGSVEKPYLKFRHPASGGLKIALCMHGRRKGDT